MRVLDANLNRCREGLRVCEDISRFILEDETLTTEFKGLRHALSDAGKKLGIVQLCKSRNIREDVGRGNDANYKKGTTLDIAAANTQRVKESMRVIEECLKALNGKSSTLIRNLRYKAYDSEKRLINKLAAIHNN